MLPQCCDCGSQDIEWIDEVNGDIIPDWLHDCRELLFDWDQAEELNLLAWQSRTGQTDEAMQASVDGLINSERYAGRRAVGYKSPARALMRRVRMGYDRPQNKVNGYQPVKANRY